MRINTADLEPGRHSASELYQIYNGLDCCLTYEIHGVLSEEIRACNDVGPALIYDFERAMQAPALDMMRRGFRIDPYERRLAIEALTLRLTKINRVLQRYAQVIWQKPLNPNSPKQMQDFLYGAMGLPPVEISFKGVRRVSTNREALEQLQAYFYALPIINCILALRDVTKKLSVLKTEIDPDNRIRTSYGVASTETGRWNSSSSVFGTGTNLQNITPELRKVFISDEGMKLCYLDLEQAESRVVGLLVLLTTGDPSYINACESGDLHTTVARLVWPHLPWTGDPKNDRQIADGIFYRQFSFRDMAKRGGHATNYYGTPRTISRHLKVEERIIFDFQTSYFSAFPGIREWHRWVAHQLGVSQCLTTPLGRRRHFFGRPGDDATLREAIAYTPQSVVGDLLNCALWRVWHSMPEVQLLAQVHDAIVFQYKEEDEAIIIPRALELTTVPIETPSRTLTIPSECKIGWNWADIEIKSSTGKTYKNPNGLIKWKGKRDERARLGGLDRVVS